MEKYSKVINLKMSAIKDHLRNWGTRSSVCVDMGLVSGLAWFWELQIGNRIDECSGFNGRRGRTPFPAKYNTRNGPTFTKDL